MFKQKTEKMKAANINSKEKFNLFFLSKRKKQPNLSRPTFGRIPESLPVAPFELPNTTCLQQMNLLSLLGIFRLDGKMSLNPKKNKKVWLRGQFFSFLLISCRFRAVSAEKVNLRAVIATNKMSSFPPKHICETALFIQQQMQPNCCLSRNFGGLLDPFLPFRIFDRASRKRTRSRSWRSVTEVSKLLVEMITAFGGFSTKKHPDSQTNHRKNLSSQVTTGRPKKKTLP